MYCRQCELYVLLIHVFPPDSWSIPLIVLKMQAFFQEKFQGRCDIIKKYVKQKSNNTNKISKLSEKKAETKSEQDILLQDIAVEIIMTTDVGDPANKNVTSFAEQI